MDTTAGSISMIYYMYAEDGTFKGRVQVSQEGSRFYLQKIGVSTKKEGPFSVFDWLPNNSNIDKDNKSFLNFYADKELCTE